MRTRHVIMVLLALAAGLAFVPSPVAGGVALCMLSIAIGVGIAHLLGWA